MSKEVWHIVDWINLNPNIKNRLAGKLKELQYSETQQTIVDSFEVPKQVANSIERSVESYKIVVDFQSETQSSFNVYKLLTLKDGK